MMHHEEPPFEPPESVEQSLLRHAEELIDHLLSGRTGKAKKLAVLWRANVSLLRKVREIQDGMPHD